MASQKDQAEACVANHNYDQARRVLAKVEGVKDLRLQQLTGWVATFKDHLQAEEDRAVEIAGKRIHEAREHEVASDYPAAIKSLEQIPNSLRRRKLKNQSLAAGTFLGQLQRKQQEVQNLERQLRERVKAKQLTGLLIEVESLLRLVPNHSNALKLKEQLLARDEKLKGLRDKLYSEAVRNLESQDYKATLSALSRIDSTQIDSAVEELRDQAETIVSTLVSLNKQIKEKLAAKEYSELENLVDHFLILKAEDNEKQRLKQQLVERDGARNRAREEGLAESLDQFKQHEYKTALASLGKIPRELVDSEVLELRDQIKGTLAQIEQLELELGRLSEDGDATALQACLQAYLVLQPNDKERQERLTRLIEEEQKAQELASNAFSRARTHASQFQFESALTELAKIPQSSLTDESRSLAQSCSKLKTLRAKAFYELNKAFRFHTYTKALETARLYQSATPTMSADKDTEFHNLRERCLNSQKAHAEELERSTEKQALKKKISMVTSLAAVVAIIVGGLLWVNNRREQQSDALASSLANKDYETALELNPKNSAALAMKKAADIERALAKGNYAAVLRLEPANVDALSMKQIADVELAISVGDYKAALQLDPSNAEALSMKRAEAIQRAMADGDYAAVLRLDSGNAEALSMKTASGIQQALKKGDYAAALELDPSNAEALMMKKAKAIEQALSNDDYAAVLRLDPSGTNTALLSLSPVKNSIGMNLKLLPAGVFTMGDKQDEHEVTLTKPFMVGIHEVTQEHYQHVMGNNPSAFTGSNKPVEQVSWEDAVEFCRRLSELPPEKAAGRIYRLPTEAEWEYACRAGTTTAYSFGHGRLLREYVWFNENVDSETHSVGSKKPNAWGLYDMHGNVWEWCQDWFGDYPDVRETDPSGARTGSARVLRGGSWYSTAKSCRSAERYWSKPSIRHGRDYGFRVALTPSGQ
jgi:formylglycine-generating enzyme required for sulfatase activity